MKVNMSILRLFLINFSILIAGVLDAEANALDQETGSAQTTASTPAPETQAGDDRKAVVRGVLANGFTYVILPRRGSDKSVAILMRVTGGFLAEQRLSERGVAHMIEHLVFLSPTNVAPNEYRRFKQVGFPLTLSEPAGGTTSWRESDYFLASRTNKLGSGLIN